MSSSDASVIHTRWRCYLDLTFVIRAWVCNWVPATYWLLRMSLCRDSQLGHNPFSVAAGQDTRLGSFPCGAERPDGAPVLVNRWGSRFTVIWTLVGEPPESMGWYRDNWWWTVPYFTMRHAFVTQGFYMLFHPLILVLPVLARKWWFTGGRTLVVVAMRLWIPITLIISTVRCCASNRICTLDTIHPTHVVPLWLLRGVVWMVPWRQQVPTVVAEVLLAGLNVTLHVALHPDQGLDQLTPYLHSAALAVPALLVASALEARLMQWVAPGVGCSRGMHYSVRTSLRQLLAVVGEVTVKLLMALLSIEGFMLVGYVVMLLVHPSWETLPPWLR